MYLTRKVMYSSNFIRQETKQMKFFQYNNQKKNGNNQDYLKENIQRYKDCIDGIKIRQQPDKCTKKCDLEKKKHNLINDEQMLIPEDKMMKDALKDLEDQK
ncbi:uncharacterized protein LOC100575688 [Acyrthosiphon pisum]|uniref:Uncharacterized protein n=1 Tax=Acyrthosiphon pisum TaxID=7029 RepID=A0A8R2AAH7_ACYPI|nr:uncharacterized protein LOC100575688 [Acyrthosiphon pisum]|eukprot:XP_003242712.1 PREDICTED: uncharacterized protein LOC100575688 [Acyrthosiphon pisum]